jgi:hypothetical protein
MEYSFEIKDELLQAVDEYHERSMLMEWHVIEKIPFLGSLEKAVNDDLIYNVPIYDMGQRKYAAFCSFTEAVWKKEKDVKGNGIHFNHHMIKDTFDWFMLFYLFRLCGSGINYKPKTNTSLFNSFIGTHGFGNFWIVDSILKNKFTHKEWLQDLKITSKPFTDNKGYLLPQFTFSGISNNHLKKFVLDFSVELVTHLYEFCHIKQRDIYEITDEGNKWLNKMGFKKQNFVLTAFAADLSEYFPNFVNKHGLVYAGTNATKCIKAIFPKIKKNISEFEYINDVLQFQSKRYNLTPIDCEDSRNCDVVRYFQEYQSKYHIAKNRGVVMKNNSILKQLYGISKYEQFSQNLK